MLSFMLRTKRVWVGPATVAAAAISYTLYIEDINRTDPDLPLVFRPESVDDMISGAINSGDIVLFDRKMTRRHIMPTISVIINKGVHDGDFDHCGVIIKDRFGTPYIYELTHNGAKLYPYSARVIRSRARQIIVVPILSPFEFSEERREELLKKYKQSVQKTGPLTYWSRVCIGLLSCSIAGLIGPGFCRIPFSPECNFALQALKEISGESFDCIPIPKSHTTTYKTLMDEIDIYSHKDKVLYVR